MGGKRFYRLASDFRHTPGNEDESHESCREGGGGHALLFRSGIYTTLLNSRQDYGSGHDQEEHAGNGPTLNPEPETNPRTIVGAKARSRWKHVEALGAIQTLFATLGNSPRLPVFPPVRPRPIRPGRGIDNANLFSSPSTL